MALLSGKELEGIESRSRVLFGTGYTVRPRSTFRWDVVSPQGTVYGVDLQAGTCTCPCYLWRGTCKHLRALRRLLGWKEKENVA